MATKPSVTVGWRCVNLPGACDPMVRCSPSCGWVLVVEGEPCPNPDCLHGWVVDELGPPRRHPCPSCVGGVVPAGGSIVGTWGVPPTRAMVVSLSERTEQ